MLAIDEKGKQEYRFKKIESKNKYGVHRSQPRIVEIIKKALMSNLTADIFDKVGNHYQNPDPNGKLFVFVVGGLSTNEIAAV